MSVALCSAGLALAHGGGGGHGGAGHGGGSHRSGAGHHRGGGGRAAASGPGGRYRGINPGGWHIPGYGYFFSSIPAYCRLVYWGGAAYYTADDVYYEWNGSVGAYQEVQPPAGLPEQLAAQAPVMAEPFVFPNGDQSNEDLERDRETCQRWAVSQSDFDPHAAVTDIKVSPGLAAQRQNYLRAEAACLAAHDYSVE